MRIGIATEETWDFLHEIYEFISQHHEVSLFKRRTSPFPFFNERSDRYLLRRGLTKFVQSNDVVFFEWASHLLVEATQLPKCSGIVTRLHRYEMYKWVNRINWEAVDKIILVSQAKRQEFINRFPDQASKAIVVTEGVDPTKFQFKAKKFSGDIGILCHIAPRKRVYELVLAFSELVKERNDLHLHIGGDIKAIQDAYYFAIQDVVKKLNLQDKVTFHGHIKDPSNWYHNIDILISNSYSEGLQVSPMEAMASGCFCLSHHWAGAEELLPEQYLYYTDRQLQEKILKYCDLSEEKKLKEKSFMRSIVCEKFNVHKTKIDVLNVIKSAVQYESFPLPVRADVNHIT